MSSERTSRRAALAKLAGIVSGRLREDVADEDWELLVRCAVEERLAPLLYWRLRDDPRLPASHRSALRSELYRSEASALRLYRALDRLLTDALAGGLAPPVLLKGGALATSLYEEIGLRPMSDLDVLVPAADLGSWLEVARRASFRRPSPEMGPGLTEAVHYQVALVGSPGEGFAEAVIEIHFGLVAGRTDWRSPDTSWFFERTEAWEPPPSLPMASARQLDPTAHLLYLAAHAMLQHGGAQARAIWLHDVHLLLSRRQSRIRWEELRERACELRWSGALHDALSWSSELFDSPLPGGFLETLPIETDDRARRLRERRSDPSMSRAELVWSELRGSALRDRIRWACAILFPRPAYMKWRYPRAGPFWPLGYPYRFGRVLWEGSKALRSRTSKATC